ncbi:hypothetical protein FA95DRAFT_411503 [Auriscalpium vulgare]|uniref:Uncharacterized protein n=1 Tax=Auriscalpium vulgare TaxID=40419 RepID=A0ACB8RHB5_9AGAM|nr:hypothetical protein FA95DRAFT_411503 [Auriscalpium vulgare]
METQEVQTMGESTTEFWVSALHSQLSRVESSSQGSLAALRNEKAAIETVLSFVNSRINASAAPIMRLPPELLVSIFSYLANQVLFESVPSMDHLPQTAPWVRFTWVCRRWRHIMLANPMLWCDLVLPLPPQWAREMLMRSQHQPLSILYSHEDKIPPGSLAWGLPFDALEQVRSIHVHDLPSIIPGNLSHLLSTQAPILEVANFSYMRSHLPREALFANSAPRLRNLTIYHANALPLSSFLPSIVSLDIRYIKNFPHSLPDFIAALQRLKRIEMLALVDCLDQFSSAPDPPAASQIIRLTSLNSLEISGMVSDCVGFLRHVQTPDTTCLHIAASTEGGADVFPVLYPLLVPASGYASNPFRAICFSSGGPGYLTFAARHADADQARWDRVFELYWDAAEAELEAVFHLVSALCAEVGVRHLLSLTLDLELGANLKVPPEGWLEMLGAATELQTLRASADVGDSLCQALSACIKEDGTYSRDEEGIPIWPKLQTLKLDQMELSSYYDDAMENCWAESIEMRVDEVLLRELKHRRQRGAALNTLYLLKMSFDVDPEWLQNVEEVVDRVVVQDE